MTTPSKGPSITVVGESSRSRILENINFDYVHLKLREGTGTTISDTGNLAASSPGNKLITAAKTIGGTTANIWSNPLKGVDQQDQDLTVGWNRDDYPEIANWLDLTGFTDYFLIAAIVETSGGPTPLDDFVFAAHAAGGGAFGTIALRYNTGSDIFSFGINGNAGSHTNPDYVNGDDISATAGPHLIVGVIDMTAGWGTSTRFTAFTDGVLSGTGWKSLPSGNVRLAPPSGHGLMLFSSVNFNITGWSPLSSLKNGGIDFVTDAFLAKLPKADFSQSTIEAAMTEWAAHPYEFPFGFNP